jgi:hypothetical protein
MMNEEVWSLVSLQEQHVVCFAVEAAVNPDPTVVGQ